MNGLATREKTRLWLLLLIGIVATLLGQTQAREIFTPSLPESGVFAAQTPASTGEITTSCQYDALDSLLAANTLSKGERLGLVYERVSGAPAATTAEEAMGQMHGTLDAVEDAFSGVPKATNPGLKPDGRMYPAQPDRIVTGADGGMSATSLKQVTTYGPNGSITVTDRATGSVLFHKPGGG